MTLEKWCYVAGKLVFGVTSATVQWALYLAYI